MKTMATIPVTREIGRGKVDRIQILRARGRTSAQIATDLGLDVYVVDEVFAWHDLLCGIYGAASSAGGRASSSPHGSTTISGRARASA